MLLARLNRPSGLRRPRSEGSAAGGGGGGGLLGFHQGGGGEQGGGVGSLAGCICNVTEQRHQDLVLRIFRRSLCPACPVCVELGKTYTWK